MATSHSGCKFKEFSPFMSIEEIKKDVTLRSYFFDLISRNLVLGLTDTFDLKSKDYVKYHKEYYQSYQILSGKLEGLVNEGEMFEVIQEVSMHYIERVGHLRFIGRDGRETRSPN